MQALKLCNVLGFSDVFNEKHGARQAFAHDAEPHRPGLLLAVGLQMYIQPSNSCTCVEDSWAEGKPSGAKAAGNAQGS